MIGRIKRELSGTRVIEKSYEDIKIGIYEILGRLKEDFPIISLDPMYIPEADSFFSITRLINPENGEKKEGPRPYNNDFESQARELSKLYKNKDVVITDVGTFEGGSEKEVIDKLRKYDINVQYVVNGISTTSANSVFDDLEVKEKTVYEYESEKEEDFIFEWIEMSDLTGLDGRKVGSEGRPLEIPGIPMVYIPYTLGDLCGWASIPENCLDEIRSYFLDITYKIIERVEEKEERTIKIGDLGLPIEIGTNMKEIKYKPNTSFKKVLEDYL